MSRNAKIILSILGGLLTLCVCVAILGGLALRRVGQSMTQDPAAARETARGITDYDLPPGYSEQMGMSIFTFDMVVIAPETSDGRPLIMLMQLPEQGGMSQEEMEVQMERSMAQQGQSAGPMEVVGTEETTIRGEPVTLTIREGSGDNAQRQVSGLFQGKGGPTMLMITGLIAAWDEGEVEEFIASLR